MCASLISNYWYPIGNVRMINKKDVLKDQLNLNPNNIQIYKDLIWYSENSIASVKNEHMHLHKYNCIDYVDIDYNMLYIDKKLKKYNNIIFKYPNCYKILSNKNPYSIKPLNDNSLYIYLSPIKRELTRLFVFRKILY